MVTRLLSESVHINALRAAPTCPLLTFTYKHTCAQADKNRWLYAFKNPGDKVKFQLHCRVCYYDLQL